MNHSRRFSANKSLGQHFLVNPTLRRRIVESCHLTSDDEIFEIGPGHGAITGLLAENVKHVYAIETDQRCVDALAETLVHANITVIKDDILRFPLDKLPPRMKVVSNLPYNIASPIIERLLKNTQQFPEIYIMVQLEFGQRMIEKPGSKEYSALSCFVQYYSDAKLLFKIPPSAFRPMPKVHSCFMKLTAPPSHGLKVSDDHALFKLIHRAFQQRRKTIVNALSPMFDKDKLVTLLTELKINLQARPENLSLQNYVEIFKKTYGVLERAEE